MIESYHLKVTRITERSDDILADLVGDGVSIAAYFTPAAGVRQGDQFTFERIDQTTWIIKCNGGVIQPLAWHFPD
jgi:hypothetical protein